MKLQSSQNDKGIARGVRELMRELGVSPRDLAKPLGCPVNRVLRLIDGQEHWTRNIKQKFAVALGVIPGKAGASDWERQSAAWEQVEGLSDEKLDAYLRRDLPDLYKL